MLRRLAAATLVLAVAALPTFAQVHPGAHVRPPSHDSLHHAPMDSAQHAALHALMHGVWTGTLSGPGVASSVQMSIARDSLHATILRATAGSPLTLGVGNHLMPAAGDTLRWTQDVSGVPCRAMVVPTAQTSRTTPTMEGTVVCPDRTLRLALRKSAE